MTRLLTHHPQDDELYQAGEDARDAAKGGEGSEEAAGSGKWLSKSERRAQELAKQSQNRDQVGHLFTSTQIAKSNLNLHLNSNLTLPLAPSAW